MTTVSTPRKIATTATTGAALTKGSHTPVNATSGALTMTLPTTAAVGVEISVEKVDTSTNAVTISGTLRGTAGSTITLTAQYDARTFLSEGSGSWRPISDHRTKTSLDATYLKVGQAETRIQWADLARPYTIAHQSTPLPYPGHTDIGYRYAVAHGFPVLDLDAQAAADNVLVNLHDTTVDNFTTATGNISDYDSSLLGVLAVDIEAWQALGWTGVTAQKLSGIAETITRYGTRLLYSIEAKSGTSTDVQRIVDIAASMGVKDQVLIQSTQLGSLAPAVAAGIRACHVTNTPDATALNAAGVLYCIPLWSSLTTAQFNALIAAGIKVIPYGVTRQFDHDTLKAISGLEGVISDDPLYSSKGDGWRKTTTAFAKKLYTSGHQLAQASRGTFSASDSRLHFAAGVNGWAGLYMLRPSTETLTGKTITVPLTFDAVGASASAFGGVHICAPDDRAYTNNAASSGYRDGYRVQHQQNGAVQVYKTVSGGTETSIGAVTCAVPTDGTTVTMTIQVTSTQIIVSIPAQTKSVTVTDSSYRGPVIHCGQNGNGGAMAVSFGEISVA